MTAGTKDSDASGSVNEAIIVRLSSDGSFDTSFNNSGTKLFDYGSDGDAFASVAVDALGNVIGGNYRSDFASTVTVQLTTNGALDTAFQTTGSFDVSEGPSATLGVVVQTDGNRIFTVAPVDVAVLDLHFKRYSPDGELDTSFNTDGKVFINADFGPNHGSRTILRKDGRLVHAGWSNDVNMAIFHFDATGSLDTSFSTDGTRKLGPER